MGSQAPGLIRYKTEKEYQAHYERNYCARGTVVKTFDGIRVYFGKNRFKDCFYESRDRRLRDKSLFSFERAERVDWIEWALAQPDGELFQGWDRDRKRHDPMRRVAVIGNYVVVVKMKRDGSAFFVTAYVATERTIRKIRSGPKWKQ